MPPIPAGAALAVKTFHHPVRGYLDIFPVRVGEIRFVEVSIWIRLKPPSSIQTDLRLTAICDAESRRQITGFEGLLRRLSAGKLCRGGYSTFQSHRQRDLKESRGIGLR